MDPGFEKSPSIPSFLQDFKLAEFQFSLQAIEPINLPEYKGSALRGGFGYAFKKVVCALRAKECPECLLKEKCIYSYIFETPPPSDSRMMRKYPAAPHPFVLLPPLEEDRIYERGEKIRFELTLIGKAIDYLPYFIYTFEELGKMGLGKGRGKFSLEEVTHCGEGPRMRDGRGETPSDERPKGKAERDITVYSGDAKVLKMKPGDFSPRLRPPPSDLAPFTLHLLFLTPTRLKFQGELTSDLRFHVFFRNLLRRISLLSYFHCGKEIDVDFRGLIQASEPVQVLRSNLHWHDWERYSTRQGERMKLGGFMGRITFSVVYPDFWPYLTLGEIVHVGKGSSFGLGKYEILSKG